MEALQSKLSLGPAAGARMNDGKKRGALRGVRGRERIECGEGVGLKSRNTFPALMEHGNWIPTCPFRLFLLLPLPLSLLL
jgi:hypothetical protein